MFPLCQLSCWILPENVGHRIDDIVAMHVFEFLVVHGRMVEGAQKIVVVDPVGLSGVEQDPVTVENDQIKQGTYLAYGFGSN